MKTTKLLIGLGLLTLGVTSCKDDIHFDQERYDQMVKDAFPVDNVDPSHSWATVGVASANIAVNGSYGKKYQVGIYLENPIGAETATLLYEEEVESGATVKTKFSYPLAQDMVYIGMFDEQGRGMAQAVKIENGQLSTVIGTQQVSAAAEDASVYAEYVKTAEYYTSPVGLTDQWGNKPTVNAVSESDMKNYVPFTDADIEKNNTLTNGSWVGGVQVFLGGGDGKHFRVAKGTTITKTFHVNAAWGVINDVVIYVEGTMHVNGNTFNGPTIVVANGGEMIVDGTTSMSGAGRIVVLRGGKITGAKGVTYNVNNGGMCYNAGTIEFDGELNVNGSDFYNAATGSIKVDVLRNTSGGKFTNFGSIEARTNTVAGDTYNSTIINGCHMKFTENAGIGTLTMLDNSRLDVAGKAEFAGDQTLYKNSVINAGALYVTNTVFAGPTNTGEFAIVKTNKIMVGNGDDCKATNNTYFDWDNTQVYDKDDQQITTNNQWSADTGVRNNITKYIDEKTVLSDFTIPAGTCTGAGYNSDGNDGGGKPFTKSFSMRYCFEDNFPEVGDYDFNDVVLTVTPVINDKTVTVSVTLDGVGATKRLAAAMRLVGIASTDLESYRVVQGFTPLPDNLAANIKNINTNETFLIENQKPNNTSSMVVVFFKDAHWAANPVLQNGTVQNYFYNTMKDKANARGKQTTVNTAVYEFKFKNADDAKKMANEQIYDVFIVSPHGAAYWEIHTVQNNYKTAQVVTSVKTDGYTQAYNSNMPWAIMVPGNDFAYPNEWTVIGEKKDGVYSGAYPKFADWAEDHTQATDWYKYPESGTTYSR